MRKGEKIPEDHINCSECGILYGFIRCRYTMSSKDGPINVCLICVPEVKKRLLRSKQQDLF